MKSFRPMLSAVLILSVVAVDVSAQTRRSNTQAARQVMFQLESHTSTFRNQLNAALNVNPPPNPRAEDNVNALLTNFNDSVRRMHNRLTARTASASDAQDVLNNASGIDRFMQRHPLDARVQRSWSIVRSDLDQLAQLYGVSWPTTGQYGYPSTPGYPDYPGYSTGIFTGTYRLDQSRSDDPNEVADRTLRSFSYSEQQRMRDQLIRRLEAPDQIAIDVRGRNVTLVSTRAPQITFDADGREHLETLGNGRTIRSVATLSRNQLEVRVTGDTNNEFSVTFNPTDSGRSLSVIRRVSLTGLGRTVEARSAYEKISDIARTDIYTGPQGYPTDQPGGDWLLRNGERIVAELNDPLSTATAREGDRFTAMVRSPFQYAGAIIGGHVSNVQRSGRISGRSQLTFNFDTIRLRDGRSYRFAGIVQTVRTPNGESATVDNEGAIQEESQSKKTVERAAIGTAVGAIIGAIAGGGKGAAIGAVIGAGGGAGSVYIQGRDDLVLPRGTEITMQATGPNR